MDNDPARGLNAAVASELRAERAAISISIDELVTRTGLAKSTVLRYLNAQRVIPMDALEIIASALGVSAFDIVRRAEVRKQNVAPTGDTAGLDELGVLTNAELNQRDLGKAALNDPEEGANGDSAGSGA